MALYCRLRVMMARGMGNEPLFEGRGSFGGCTVSGKVMNLGDSGPYACSDGHDERGRIVFGRKVNLDDDPKQRGDRAMLGNDIYENIIAWGGWEE